MVQKWRSAIFTGLLALFLIGQSAVSAGEPLHEAIDRLVAGGFAGKQPAPLADEATFLRRVWLDLAGRIPSSIEARNFLADDSADKRVQLIDHLLAAPTYAERMENLLDVMLMERRGDDKQWRKFLHTSFEQNMPWDQMVRHLLAPDDQNETTRGSAFFYTKRLENYGQNPIDYPGLTRDVGRLFLGVDLQCAECHDHLFIDDYEQRDFQGLFAIYKNLSIRRGANFPAVDEKARAEKIEFVSVFDPTQRETGPRIPFGKEFTLPEMSADKHKQDESKFSALALLASELPSAKNKRFVENIANRLWFVMMGQGLVEPLDLFHSDNSPSHPELLTKVADEFAAHQFDIKWLLRELALSETYQRSSLIPADQQTPAWESYLVANEKRLSAEQLFLSTLQATGNLDRLRDAEEDGKSTSKFQELKARFVTAFANEPREPETDFSATVKGALFLLNDDEVLALLRPQAGNLTDRLSKLNDTEKRTDELFLSVLTRPPTEAERAAVTEYLQQNPERTEAAIGHVVWGMLTSMEFAANH